MPFSSSKANAPLMLHNVCLIDGRFCDVFIGQGVIQSVNDTVLSIDCENSSMRIIEAGGNLLLPGLHEHHMHLFATAAARASVSCGPPEVKDEATLREQLYSFAEKGADWIRGVAYHDSVLPDLNRYWLDDVCPDRPMRIQHRSGMMWILNSRALEHLRLGSDEEFPDGAEKDQYGELTGRFYNLDDWLRRHLPSIWPSLKDISAELASYGITAVTDTGVNNGVDVWEQLNLSRSRGDFVQRLQVMGNEELHDLVAGHTYTSFASIGVGALKIYLREVDFPQLEELVSEIRCAHDYGRPVAFHCVTLPELYFALQALEEAGVIDGDRIEHASIADDYAVDRLARLNITVVTQPNFIAERGDQYLVDVDACDIPLLYRGSGFINSGVRLAAGSDAPYGLLDPWLAMDAAVNRRTKDGAIMEDSECLNPLQALSLFGGDLSRPGSGLRKIEAGQPADLCLLDVSAEELFNDFSSSHVRMTICDGEIIFEA